MSTAACRTIPIHVAYVCIWCVMHASCITATVIGTPIQANGFQHCTLPAGGLTVQKYSPCRLMALQPPVLETLTITRFYPLLPSMSMCTFAPVLCTQGSSQLTPIDNGHVRLYIPHLHHTHNLPRGRKAAIHLQAQYMWLSLHYACTVPVHCFLKAQLAWAKVHTLEQVCVLLTATQMIQHSAQ